MKRRECHTILFGLLAGGRLTAASIKIEQNVQNSPIVDAQGRIDFRFPIFSGFVNFQIGGNQTLKMACVPGGMGTIGSNKTWDTLRLRSTPVHKVRIKPFLLGCFEVTRSQWFQAAQLPQVNRPLQVLFSEPRSSEEGNWPVESPISFLQAEEFCARISAYTGVLFRLPSEAEWEYSCRAATTTNYHFGDTYGPSPSDSQVFSQKRFQPVGTMNAPNRFGLNDMHGGVLEWCQDWENSSYERATTDGSPLLGVGTKEIRIVRGYEGGRDGGSAARWSFAEAGFVTTLGLRVAASLDHGIMDSTVLASTNSASYAGGIASPGQVISIFGDNLGPDNPSTGTVENGLIGRSSKGVEVYFDDLRAPLVFVSKSQLNVVAPFGIALKEKVRVVVRNGFQSAHFLELLCKKAQPAIFSMDGTGRGPAAALNADGSLHGSNTPLASGEIVVVFGTGFGLFEFDFADGEIVSRAVALRDRATVFASGKECVVEYAGAAPGQVAGIVQVNFRIPEGLNAGAVSVVIAVSGERSPDGVTIFVR